MEADHVTPPALITNGGNHRPGLERSYGRLNHNPGLALTSNATPTQARTSDPRELGRSPIRKGPCTPAASPRRKALMDLGCNHGAMRDGREKPEQHDTSPERQQIACDHQEQEARVPRLLTRGMPLQPVALARHVLVGSGRKR